MPASYSLYELNEYIRRVVALNFAEPIWVDCEIAQVKEVRGNVYLDLVWLPQISREEAVNSLDLMLDCVPYNKFFWGGDCGLIEESVGSLEFAKDVLSEVLAKRVKRGLLTEDLALEIIDRIFSENAIEVFDLENRLGKSF